MHATPSLADPTDPPRSPPNRGPRTRDGAQPPRPAAGRDGPSPATWIEGPAERVMALARRADARVREKPVSTIALIACAGFLVGGGLSFRGGRLLLAAAVRHMTREVLKQVL